MRGFLLLLCAAFVTTKGATQSIRINEILADNDKIIADSAGEFDDVVELYNSGNETVSLFRWHLSDDPNNLKKFRFGNVTIAPGEFLLVWCDEDVLQPGIHANFRLNVNGESLILTDDDETIIDSVTYPQLAENVSWARYPDAGPFKYMYPTIGRPNVFLSAPEFRNAGSLQAFPNPVNAYGVVRFNTPIDQGLLVDAFGKIVREIEPKASELQIGDLAPGIYVIMLPEQRIKLIVQ
jgi:hypothetical protein